MAFGQRFKFIRGHERPAHHLQALAGIVLSPADGTGQHRPVAQRLGENVGAFRIRCKTAEQDILAVVNDNAGSFFAIVLLKLGEALDDGYH